MQLSNAGGEPEVRVHTHTPAVRKAWEGPLLVAPSTARAVAQYLEEGKIKCSFSGVHEHHKEPRHHHHTLQCLIDAGMNHMVQENISLKMEVFTKEDQLQQLAGQIQRDAYTRMAMAPIVDLAAMWAEKAQIGKIEDPIAFFLKFSTQCAGALGMAQEWLDHQIEVANKAAQEKAEQESAVSD